VKLVEDDHVLEVEADSAHDIFIRREALVDHVSVVDDISAEKEGADDGIDEVESVIEWEENRNETSEDHRNQGGKKERAHAGEVILYKDISLCQDQVVRTYLGLESKQS